MLRENGVEERAMDSRRRSNSHLLHQHLWPC